MSDFYRCGVRGFPVSRRQAIVGCLAACAASSLPGAGETGQAKDVAWDRKTGQVRFYY